MRRRQANIRLWIGSLLLGAGMAAVLGCQRAGSQVAPELAAIEAELEQSEESVKQAVAGSPFDDGIAQLKARATTIGDAVRQHRKTTERLKQLKDGRMSQEEKDRFLRALKQLEDQQARLTEASKQAVIATKERDKK